VSFKDGAYNDSGMVLCGRVAGQSVQVVVVPILIAIPRHAIRGGDIRVSLSGGDEMDAVKITAIILIVAGVLGLAYGGFSYTKETHQATIGPIDLSVKEKQRVNVPVWAGVGAIVIGGVLLVIGSKKI
jgi:hypothetical protein